MSHGNVARFTRVVGFGGLCVAWLWFSQPASASERSAMQACRADAQKLCAGVQFGGGRIAACLRENEGKVSSACQAQLGKVDTCTAEIKRLCAQAQGEGELRQCAKSKGAELSVGCRAAAGG